MPAHRSLCCNHCLSSRVDRQIVGVGTPYDGMHVVVTGRRYKAAGAGNARTSRRYAKGWQYEYFCPDCGHIGRSAHQDIQKEYDELPATQKIPKSTRKPELERWRQQVIVEQLRKHKIQPRVQP